MKIIHSSGKELKINPGTVLEMERTNPFFNEYGEQSTPVKLPPSAHNRLILGFPESMAGTDKMPQRADAAIQDGVFYINCRQAILQSSLKDGIDTSFYLNIGSFYEKMKDIQLSTVFNGKVVKFYSVNSAVNFVRGLMVTPDRRFSCFEVLTKNQDTDKVVSLNKVVEPLKSDGYLSFYNEIPRQETVDEKSVSIPAGYYITPFVKVMYVLEEIFKYLGYTLEESFFSKTEPFKSKVFLNNNIDTIVNGEIRLDQIVPNCNVSTILNIFRNKYCCEFIPNENNKTVKIVLFNDVLDGRPTCDLSGLLTTSVSINHGAVFKQIRLSAEKGPVLSYDSAVNLVSSSPDYLSKTMSDIEKAYPGAVVNKAFGIIYREGFYGDKPSVDIVGNLNCDYYAGGDLEVGRKESPDVMVSIGFFIGIQFPFVGVSRSVNSKLIWSDTSQQNETEDTKQDKSELKPMLCFTAHRLSRNDIGTVYAHLWTGERLWNYTLCYNGEDGLYEKFWRRYDDMLRNSMRPVEARLLLRDLDKLNLSAHEKISINNQELLPNVIKYNIGKNADTECTFFTTRLYNPVSSAIPESSRFVSKYRWAVKSVASVTGSYTYFQHDVPPVVFYPLPPKEAEFLAGGRYYEKKYAGKFHTVSGYTNGVLTVWLEPVIREG